MSELKQLTDHHAFIMRTDRKSLYTQIKGLVNQAQEVASKELNQRQHILKLLLEHEDRIYEEEFANKVKSRIDEDIRERKDILLRIREENKKNELEFLKSKRIQQYMNSCYEIREALRRKEMNNVKECQLEQILEKERTVKKEKDLDKYWQNVQDTSLRLMNEQQQQEECLKKHLVKYTTDIQKIQLEELQEKREKERQEKLEEKQKLDDLLEELRLEEFNRKLQGKPSQVTEYRNELLKMINEKQKFHEEERREEVEMHRKMMAEIKCIEKEENAEASEKKKAFHQSTLDFITYVKRMRQFEEEQQQKFYERIEDLNRVDMCTKNNILFERQRKALKAEKNYNELRKQIAEQREQRLREEAEYRECKMQENRFVHDEITREEIIAQKQKNRKDLDQQIKELKKIRAKEKEKYSSDFKRVSNDPEFCDELAEQYIREGIDYLEPHANWRILASPSKGSTKSTAKNLETFSCTDGNACQTEDGRDDELIGKN